MKIEITENHLTMVKKLAWSINKNLPAYFDVDDLIQAGLMGLIDAIEHYEPVNNAKFETYAYTYVRGSILAEVRKTNWAPKLIIKNMKTLGNVRSALEHKYGRVPTPSEVACELEVPLNEYHQMLAESSARMVQMEEHEPLQEGEDFSSVNPADIYENKNLVAGIVAAMDALDEKERKLISDHYEHEKMLQEVSADLKMSRSTCQRLHNQAIASLRDALFNMGLMERRILT